MITLVLVLVLVLRIINLYFYRTSSQQVGVPSGPFLVSRTGAVDEPNAELKCQNGSSSDPTKGVGCLKQQDGGHGSRNPLRSV